jgi:hypothetical protein
MTTEQTKEDTMMLTTMSDEQKPITEVTEQEWLNVFMKAAHNGKEGKVSPAARQFAKLAPELTPDEWPEVAYGLAVQMLLDDDLDPELRRDILSRFDTCPCCHRWMGHNHPPSDDGDAPPQRQASFGF